MWRVRGGLPGKRLSHMVNEVEFHDKASQWEMWRNLECGIARWLEAADGLALAGPSWRVQARYWGS